MGVAKGMLVALPMKKGASIVVSVGKSGKLRRHGPCPCQSSEQFMDCCLPKIKAGKKPRARIPRSMMKFLQPIGAKP